MNRVMPRTGTPRASATQACASSWPSTDRRKRTAVITAAGHAASAPTPGNVIGKLTPSDQTITTKNSNQLQCSPTVTPPIRPNLHVARITHRLLTRPAPVPPFEQEQCPLAPRRVLPYIRTLGTNRCT